jgi:hypothetical protein
MRLDRPLLSLAAALLLVACGGGGADDTPDAGDEGEDPPPVYLKITGQAVDFETAAALSGDVVVSTLGLTPAPSVTVTGASFEITPIPAHSFIYVAAGSDLHRGTVNPPIEVQDADVTGVVVQAVSEAMVEDMEATFGVTQDPGKGIVLARILDEDGLPLAGVPRAAFRLNDAAPPVQPYFLDGSLSADAGLAATSASGYVVFFDVEPGLATVGATQASGYELSGAPARVLDGAVSLAVASTPDADAMRPMNVSFSNDVMPIFTRRFCANCHGIGNAAGGLTLRGNANRVHGELTQEISAKYGVTRVDLLDPPNSLVLTMPSFEDPPDDHPNVTFASPTDPDYLLLLVWIEEGAPNN